MTSTKTIPVLEAERILLRPIRLEDVSERYLSWLNDPEVNQYLETRFQAQSLETIRDFVERMASKPDEHLFSIRLKEGSRHIGNIKIGPIHPYHRSADISLFIGEKDCWGKGYATEAIALLTRFGFEDLGLNKLRACCYAPNEGSARAFEKCGWSREGLQKGLVQHRGRETDVILLGIRSGEFKCSIT